MPQSLAQVYLHLAWSTKNRVPFLKDEALRTEMHSYLAGACKNMDSPPLRLEALKIISTWLADSPENLDVRSGQGTEEGIIEVDQGSGLVSQGLLPARKTSKRNSADC
ncbi:MAG: hypothetical protein GY835_28255 [bacterium]|nr:hypothetical protein [bacterium]